MKTRFVLAALLSLPGSAFAQGLTDGLELSFYTGIQEAPHSTVSGSDSDLGDYSFFAEWEGRSGDMPPYYGFRATWWKPGNWGWGFELNHTKIYASDETLADNGIDHLEFSDGLNIITANYARRWPEAFGRFTPYVIGGIGIAVPHVELEVGGNTKAYEYQLTGPALEAVAGLSYSFNDRWSAFGEYKFTYSQNKADLAGGGTLETDVITNALNLGVAFSF
jgi:lipid A oxidase